MEVFIRPLCQQVCFQTPGKWMMYIGAAIILFMTFKWMGTVITESVTGKFKGWEDKSFRVGMIVFICSEVAFFAAFFGALFYMRILSVPELAGYDADITPYKDFLSLLTDTFLTEPTR